VEKQEVLEETGSPIDGSSADRRLPVLEQTNNAAIATKQFRQAGKASVEIKQWEGGEGSWMGSDAQNSGRLPQFCSS